MIVINSQLAALRQIRRTFQAKVESLTGSTIVDTFNHTDRLVSFEIERLGLDGKFFGFGISQKARVKLKDVDRTVNLTTDNKLRVRISALADGGTLVPYPLFQVEEINRDENTNELTVIAYDVLHSLTNRTFSELGLTAPYTLADIVNAITSQIIGGTVTYKGEIADKFTLSYEEGANLEGSENLRDILNAIAEATQTIYFIDRNNNLVFLRLSDTSTAALTISKEDYFTLQSETCRTLTAIASITELGDNVISAQDPNDGSTQYIRNNPFLELRADLATLLDTAIAEVGGITIYQFDCSWRGNFLMEPGDRIDLTTKDNDTISSYIINDTITYNGGLSGTTSWSYEEGETEHANPTTVGEVLKETYAKVDKVNKEIDLVAGEVDNNTSAIASLAITTSNITSSVQRVEAVTEEALDKVNENIAILTNRVDQTITSEDVQIQIRTELENGIDKVTTSTGFTFNENGLTISKSGTEIKTIISEDGMIVFRNDDEVLVADNEGVKAQDLHATTFLIIGLNSRFEDFDGGRRTGCFWIG